MRLPTYTQGTGPAVVMVHGRGEAHDSWLPVLPYLDGYQIIRVDLPGFGAAPAPEGPEHYTIEASRDDLAETLEDLDRPFALVGHSMGGMIAASFAAHYGHRVSALVLESAAAAYPYTDEHYPQQHEFLNLLADLLEQKGSAGAIAHLQRQYGLDGNGEAIIGRSPAHVLSASIRGNDDRGASLSRKKTGAWGGRGSLRMGGRLTLFTVSAVRARQCRSTRYRCRKHPSETQSGRDALS